MVDKTEKIIYYVSDLGTGRVSIIDGDSYRIIKEIEIGPRPQDIIVDEKNNVYIASDRNSKVTLIHDLYDSDKSWDMPNNGNIQVDSISQKIYVCDTEEVCIYSLRTGEKIGRLTGFIAADSLKLDKDKKRLFVLDILQNEIKVYDTSYFNLIKIYKEVGTSPNCILIGEDEKYMYISNKGINKGNYTYTISILDFESGNISYINLEKGSVITDLEQSGILLYAANSRLNRIDVIDIVKRECIAWISTTLPQLLRLLLSPDKKTLLVTSKNADGKGVIDRIDTTNNNILDTITFEQNNIMPCNMGMVIQRKLQLQNENNSNCEIENLKDCLTKVKILKREKEELLAKLIITEEELNRVNEARGYEKNQMLKLQCQFYTGKEKIKSYLDDKNRLKEKNSYLENELLLKEKEKILIEKKLTGKEKENKTLKQQIEITRVQNLSNSEKSIKESINEISKQARFSLIKWLFNN